MKTTSYPTDYIPPKSNAIFCALKRDKDVFQWNPGPGT